MTSIHLSIPRPETAVLLTSSRPPKLQNRWVGGQAYFVMIPIALLVLISLIALRVHHQVLLWRRICQSRLIQLIQHPANFGN